MIHLGLLCQTCISINSTSYILLLQATIAKVAQSKFIKKVKEVDTNRDYSILVDTSGSMMGQRWVDVCYSVCVSTRTHSPICRM